MKPVRFIERDAPPRAVWALEQSGVHPLMARLLCGRGVRQVSELDHGLANLIAPDQLLGAAKAAGLLADAIQANTAICVVADYDCDGATACALAIRGLRLLGARSERLHYVVPDRAVHGYGLTPAVVDLAAQRHPKILVTVDNGIASVDGVAHAKALGMSVLITDHHLPAMVDGVPALPAADVIVNPNQPSCLFPSKQLAGVGVMFYVLLALRQELRARGTFTSNDQPRLDSLLDLVALGTVADVVRLDANNRRLVAQGLQRIRAGRMLPGITALFAVAGRDPRQASSMDFGFALGPRLNAAGRLSDMTLGIECLLTDDNARAAALAEQLDAINRERQSVEATMRDQAYARLDAILKETEADEVPPAVALFDPAFHEGVVGIVAARVKDRLHRPTFVFAPGKDGVLKGSGRSIPGFHLRDALDLVAKRNPNVLLRFGGHAMAAGASLQASQWERFAQAFQQVARETLDATVLQRSLATDGSLAAEYFTPTTVRMLEAEVWGQGFEAPTFSDTAEVLNQRIVGERHLKLALRVQGEVRDAIWFGRTEPLPPSANLAFRIGINAYQGRETVQLLIEAQAEAA
jgi:single-stranded-DNA-specific exonuclease